MLPIALIVFREVLEAALVVTVVMAATRGLRYRNYWVGIGIAGGVAGAAIVAALAHFIAKAFQGTGQEIVNATILFLAVGLIGWHVVWMNSHGRKIAHDMRAVGKSVTEGKRHMSILAIVVGLAVMREGSEIVLMVQGLLSTSGAGSVVGGCTLGLGLGVLAGGLIYAGFLTLSVGRLFAVTNSILILIAAGMAAHAANFLSQADLLPQLGARWWDSSFILSDESVLGKGLGALIGYIARPNGIEVIFYAATIIAVFVLMRLAQKKQTHFGKVSAAIIILIGSLTLSRFAHADEVMSPYIEEHEWEFEQEGIATTHDQNPGNAGAQNFEASIGYSPTAWWSSELETEFERAAGPDQRLHYTSFNWLNTIALAEPGEYWIDPAIFLEGDFANDHDAANSVIFGLIGAKQIGPVLTTVNLFGHKEYGTNAAPIAGFAYSDQTKYLWKTWLQPGFEVFGDTDGQTMFRDQKLAAGPGIFGKFFLSAAHDLKYEMTYLFGATPATPDQQIRWKLEYEFFF